MYLVFWTLSDCYFPLKTKGQANHYVSDVSLLSFSSSFDRFFFFFGNASAMIDRPNRGRVRN